MGGLETNILLLVNCLENDSMLAYKVEEGSNEVHPLPYRIVVLPPI